MAVKIKLKRLGKIREPYYRIVVADSRTKRDGRAIEEIGKYHPKAEPSLIEVNSERVQHWLSVGAQPTDPVRVLLKITGDWQKFTGEPGAEGTLRTAEPRADKKERFDGRRQGEPGQQGSQGSQGEQGRDAVQGGQARQGHSAQGHRRQGQRRQGPAAKDRRGRLPRPPRRRRCAAEAAGRRDVADAAVADGRGRPRRPPRTWPLTLPARGAADAAVADAAADAAGRGCRLSCDVAAEADAAADAADAEATLPRLRPPLTLPWPTWPLRARPKRSPTRRPRLTSRGAEPDVLEEALEHLVRGIVQYPDDVQVASRTLRRGNVLEVRVHPDDLGKVIGRGGRTARALRTVIGALAAGRYVRIDLLDANEVR